MRADDLIERTRLRRKLSFWRICALLIVAVAIGAVAYSFGSGRASSRDHIAKVRIEGTIFEDEKLIERLEDVRKSASVKGVILSIDSPGGTTTGGEAIFEEVRRLAGDKPVVAQVGTLAASAGYMIATASDHIVARQTSIVGSIGVLVQFPNFTGLMEKVGITLDEVKSSPLKAEPSPFNPTTEPERAMLRSLIMDSYDWFVGIVADRRSMSRQEVIVLADGSIFTGRQALQKRLVDAVGGEETAIDWLETRGVDRKLEVIEWKPKETASSFLLSNTAMDRLASILGYPSGGSELIRQLGIERLFLDGMVSVWQPD
ncbi:MAG: signal peptide peptidase SppA [Rhizobiaceae bacterium]|nr:signal peptide peptidase SppA [Rhizobiaceae bacterium]